MTILEVVVSLVLLIGVGTMVLSALGYVERAAARDRIRLAAYEACHRIILQFIDDPESIRRASDPVFVNGYEFGFEFIEELLVSETREEGGVFGVAQREYDLETLLSNKLKLVRVRVWLTERKAGFAPEQTVASLNRMYNIMNNPERLLEELRAATAGMRDNQ
jgi:hypothetical protein